MTRTRTYGSDTPFCEWMRNCQELPSMSQDCGLSATDCDVIMHRFGNEINGQFSRKVQGLMQIEIKTRGGAVPGAQLDTLRKQDLNAGIRHDGGQVIHHFGVFILTLSGTNPNDSDYMSWSFFNYGKTLSTIDIDYDQLIQLLRFELHPQTLAPLIPSHNGFIYKVYSA